MGGVVEKIVAAFINYFVEVKSARIRFWLKPQVPTGVEFINLPVTALFFSAACTRYSGMPSGEQYVAQLSFYLISVLFLAGITCLFINKTRDDIGGNIRKFLSVVWIVSTFGAALIAIDFWLPWISAAEFVVVAMGGFGFPDVLIASVPAALFGLGIVAGNEYSLRKRGNGGLGLSVVIAVIMLLVASTAGLAIMIRPLSGPGA